MTSEELTSLLDLYAREKAAADATGVVNGHWIAIEAVADAVRQADVAVVERAMLPEEHAEECDAYSARVGRRRCINALCDGEVRAEAAEKQLQACLAALKDGAK